MIKRWRSLILFFSLCIISLFLVLAKAQESQAEAFDPEKKFPPEHLKSDFELLREALEEGHGGLYYYTPKEELDRQFDRILRSLDQSLTELDFFRLLAPLIASIHDGHTGILLSPAYRTYLENEPVLLPFNLRFIEQKTYIFRNYSQDEDFVAGGEVISINEYPISEILERMMPVIPSDGHVQTSKYRRLENTARFGETYNLLFGKTISYSITYRTADDNELNQVKVKGINRKELNSIFEERYTDVPRNLPPIELEYRENIAVLTIRTFGSAGYRRAGISYPSFMKSTFKELEEKKINHLIIDLRNNGGGDDLYGKILVAYLMDRPFKYYEHLRVRNKELAFLAHTNVPEESRKALASRLKQNESGTYDLLFHPNLGEQKPMQPTFKGKVYVLINGASFSGSGECTSLIHFHKKAVFIGEECGAGYYGNTSGFMPRLTLPHTGIQIRIPVVRYSMAVSGYPPDRGIIPDYPVSPSIKDSLSGRDAELEFVIELIRKSK
jgi:hypothetical protein